MRGVRRGPREVAEAEPRMTKDGKMAVSVPPVTDEVFNGGWLLGFCHCVLGLPLLAG